MLSSGQSPSGAGMRYSEPLLFIFCFNFDGVDGFASALPVERVALLAFFLRTEDALEEPSYAAVLPLVAEATTVSLGVIKEVGVVVGRVGEEIETELSARVELDLDIQVTHYVRTSS